MKKIHFTFLFSCVLFFCFAYSNAQSVKKLKDSHIVAQEKRQVALQWGDWRPEKKTVLGVNVNIHYTLVWGWLAPARNRKYRKGNDIRPLSPTGLQNQRMVTTLIQEEETKKIADEVDLIEASTFEEYMHISSLTTEADPLYLLYYKKMLKPLKEQEGIDKNAAGYYLGKMGMSEATAARSNEYGLLNRLVADLQILTEKYKMARTADMPRGKRIIMYHECLLEWRKKMQYVVYLERQTKIRQASRIRLNKIKSLPNFGRFPERQRRDAEIFVDVLMNHQQTF